MENIIIGIFCLILVIGFNFICCGCFVGLIYWLISLIFNISFVWKYLFIMTGILTLFIMLFGKVRITVEH